MRFISQLISSISRVPPKLKCFNGTDVLTSFAYLLIGAFPVIFALDFNDSNFDIIAFDSFL